MASFNRAQYQKVYEFAKEVYWATYQTEPELAHKAVAVGRLCWDVIGQTEKCVFNDETLENENDQT